MQKELRVLMVEDVPADAELIIHELRKAKIRCSVKCVETKKAFLSEIRQSRPDIIISDFSLPQFNALDALHALKAHRVHIPFILVTGSQSEEVAVECIKEGADDYILKASLKRLPTAIINHINKKKAEEQKVEAETALRRSEELFRSLIENSSDIITILNEEGVIQYQSPSLERVLGYGVQEMVGRSAFDLIHPADRPFVVKSFQTALIEAAVPHVVEYRFQHKDGSWRWIESASRHLAQAPGATGIVVNSREVTERKQAEGQIREQATLLDKAQDAILAENLHGTVTFWNESAGKLYGWSRQEALGRTSNELVFAPDLPEVVKTARRTTLEKGEWAGELPQVARDGKALLVESRWSLVRNAEGGPESILIISSDITAKKKLEDHFLRAQRMESIGTLAGGIAHDLNNVLTPILMSIRLLRDELKEGSAQELLDTLESSAHRGASIVQQVLSFARGVEGEKVIFQIKHPLSEVVKIARDTFPPLIHIRTKLAQDLWPVYGDPTHIHQVFMNLVVNARDAMPNGGRLLIDADNTFVDENYAKMQGEAKAGPYVVVSVSDTGTGIPPGLLTRIFEPFFTTKELGKGTGLGLSTAIGIVKSHGGFLTVYSEPGKGTCFKVHFPASDASVDADVGRTSMLDVPDGHNELLLVVDDELAIREIIKVTLQDHGYRVLTANDGAEAVAIYAQYGKDVTAVIIDVMMPYMDGPTTIRAIQKIDPKARFVAVSGLMENRKLAELQELGEISFLPKPFTTEQLLITLRAALEQPAPVPRL